MNVYGLAVSEGEIVSLQDRRDFAATITFDVNNRASIIYTNWPATSVEGVFTDSSDNGQYHRGGGPQRDREH
ncbi:MAG: hypothetical protein O2960_14275 [Verrucomicrobia bacterium]|nr:hypothetical protein [Verrucomicrobiota bacterium]